MSDRAEHWVWPTLPKNEWGPRGWNWLHITAINYPEEPTLSDARTAYSRIWAFVSNLPCAVCRRHAKAYVVRSPPGLGNSYALQIWVWQFHNSVNSRLGKPLMAYDEYLRTYEDEICWAKWSEGCGAVIGRLD